MRHTSRGVACAALVITTLFTACAVEEDAAELDEIEATVAFDPIIFVHGCPRPPNTEAAASAFFDAMKSYLIARGYPAEYLYTFVHSGPLCESTAATAAQLADLVRQVRDATHRPRVDIVGHSMGGLTARYYIAQQGGRRCVQDFVSVGAPHHGTDAAVQGVLWQDVFGGYPVYEAVQEVFPAYACAGMTYLGSEDVQAELNGCLNLLGRSSFVDETPGDVRYMSIRNLLGQEIVPSESSCLNQRWQNDCGDTAVNRVVTAGADVGPCPPVGVCPPDIAVMWNPATLALVSDFVAPGSHESWGDRIDEELCY